MADFAPDNGGGADDAGGADSDAMSDDGHDDIELLEAPDEGGDAPKENVDRVTTRYALSPSVSSPPRRPAGVSERAARAGT